MGTHLSLIAEGLSVDPAFDRRALDATEVGTGMQHSVVKRWHVLLL